LIVFVRVLQLVFQFRVLLLILLQINCQSLEPSLV